MEEMFDIVELHGERSRIWQGYSRYGYTPQTALADIIDNSLGAGATVVKIDISEQADGSNKVYITDNGDGMTPERFKVALAPGSPEDIQNSRLSKFGFGMKTASLEVSPEGFSVLTRSKNGGQLSAASLLREHQVGKGSIQAAIHRKPESNTTWLRYLESAAGPGGSGTVMIWENADLKKADRYKEEYGTEDQTKKRVENRIARYLGMVFHRWIEGNNEQNRVVRIIFQGVDIEPWNPLDPKYLDRDQVSEIPPFIVSDDNGEETVVTLEPWVIDKSLSKKEAEEQARKGNKHQGIYVYRMDRIINNPQWFDLKSNKRDPLNGLRFALDISPNLDDTIHLDVKKSHIDLPDELLSQISPYVDIYIKSEEARAHKNKAEGNKTKTPLSALEAAAKKLNELEKTAPTVRPERQSNTEVITTNQDGQRLPLHMKELPSNLRGENLIHLVPASETSGYLWEPRTARDLSLQVLINEDHDFYQKVMLASTPEAYQGFVWMIAAFSKAELATQYSNFKLQFSHMRRHMSETLESYAADLEMPDLLSSDE
jgi:hypothetical protein